MKKIERLRLKAASMGSGEMKNIRGGVQPRATCTANCPKGTITLYNCNGTCTASDGVSVSCTPLYGPSTTEYCIY